MHGVVGDQAEGFAFDAHQRGDHPGGEVPAQFEHRAAVGQLLDDLADVVDAQTILRHRMAQQALVGALPVGDVTLEVGKVLAGDMGGFGFIFHQHVDHPVGALHVAGADFLGGEFAQAAAFDHGRAGHPQAGVAGGDDHVAAAEQGGVAGEAASGDHAHQRHQPGEPRQADEAHVVQPGHADEVGIAGAPAAASA